jgi:hypothetical protein
VSRLDPRLARLVAAARRFEAIAPPADGPSTLGAVRVASKGMAVVRSRDASALPPVVWRIVFAAGLVAAAGLIVLGGRDPFDRGPYDPAVPVSQLFTALTP